MEKFTADEKSLIEDALTQYWHQAINELNKRGLGDIERKNWEYVKENTQKLFTKFKIN